MAEVPPFFARLSDDGQTVAVARGRWKHRFPAVDLPRWIRLYTSLRDKHAGRAGKPEIAAIYEPGVKALQRIADQLKEREK